MVDFCWLCSSYIGDKMCGIFGIIYYSQFPPTYDKANTIRKVAKNLLVESERRGTDASGLCVVGEKKISIFKTNLPASKMIGQKGYSDVIGAIKHGDKFRALIGHTRLKTKGSEEFNVNNHPIVTNKVVGVHNGIIGNDELIFRQHAGLARRGEVDSEVIFQLIDSYMECGNDIAEAVKSTHAELSGSYACAFIHAEKPNYVTLFKNSWAPVYLHIYDSPKLMVFASDTCILTAALKGISGLTPFYCTSELAVQPNTGMRINTNNGKIYEFELGKGGGYCHAEWVGGIFGMI